MENKSKDMKKNREIINKINKLIGKDLLKYVPAKFIPAILSLISLPIYTNIFSPEEYGIYSMVMSGINLISNLVAGWIGHSALRYYDDYNNYKNDSSVFFSTIFCVLFLFYIIIILVYIIVKFSSISLNWNQNYLLLVSVILLLTASARRIIRKILMAGRYTILFSIISVLLPGGKLLFVILLNKYLNTSGVILLLLSTTIIEFFILFIFVIKIKPKFNFKHFNKKLTIKMLKYGLPLLANSLLAWVLSVSDRYLIGILKSSNEVGLYSISYKIGSFSLKMVFVALMLAAHPIIIKAWNQHGKKYVEKLISRLIKYYYILCIPIVSALFVMSSLLLNIFTTESYYNGHIVLPWVGLGTFMLGLSQYLHKVWELKEETYKILMMNIIAALSNLILNFIFIPKYGFLAAGITTFISYSMYNILILIFMKNIFEIDIINKDLVVIILSSLVMLIPVYYVISWLEPTILTFVFSVIIGASFYFFLLYISGVMEKEFTYIIKKILKLQDNID